MFYIRPSAWTSPVGVVPLDTIWTRELLTPTHQPQEQLSPLVLERVIELLVGSRGFPCPDERCFHERVFELLVGFWFAGLLLLNGDRQELIQ